MDAFFIFLNAHIKMPLLNFLLCEITITEALLNKSV